MDNKINNLIVDNSSDKSIIENLNNLLIKEQSNNKKLIDEITKLNKRLSDNNSSENFTQGKLKEINQNLLEINLDNITLLNKIGEGGFSIIHKGLWLFNEFAIKIIFDPKITEELLNEFYNEINMLNRLRHPNIVSLIAITKQPKLSIITEYAQCGSLFNLLHKQR